MNGEESAAYDKVDRFLRNNLNDADYAEYSAALEVVASSGVRVERERCAAICESVNNHDNPMTAKDCADAIRLAGWCCPEGEAAGVPVCSECAEASAGYSAAMRATE